jgi:glycerate 2-kinase
MNLLIACDSFKDALDAPSVCKAIEKGLRAANTVFETRIFPLADGGEGVLDILDFHLGLQKITISVHDPLMRPIMASYSLSRDGHTAFIEMAQAAGLQRLRPEERNPLKTTTFGVGEMILHALNQGVKHIVLGIGGSATNDLGIGMVAAMGWQFLDGNDKLLSPIGENLMYIHKVIPPQYPSVFLEKNIQFEVMCDVKNPLLGKNGAAHIYSAQKGADNKAIELLEKGASHFCLKLKNADILAETQGAGAAGGLGFGALFFLDAHIKSGIETLMDLTNFDGQVSWADMVFTGEGRLDNQTAHGKLIAGILARAHHKPVIALCGDLAATPQYIQDLGLKAAFSINPKPCTLHEALANTAINLEKTAFNIGRLL